MRAGPTEVAVIRALPGLGDCLCLVPALRRLRAGAPSARTTVIGHPAGRWMTARFPELVDGWIDLPHWPSIIECRGTREETASLLRRVRRGERRFDLALQLHGSGGPINWLGVALGARAVVVHTTLDRLGPWTLAAPWPEQGHEADRLADLVGRLGFPDVDRSLTFPVGAADRVEADRALGAAGIPGDAPVVVVHPGASRPDRRWHAAGFGVVARAASDAGRRVVVTAGPGEEEIARAVVAATGSSGVPVMRGLGLGGLAALLERAVALVVNDTGVAHLGVAVGTPCVVAATTSDIERWGPRDRIRNRVVEVGPDPGCDASDRVVSALTDVSRSVGV